MKIISLASGKGGVGKTTITSSLGHILSVMGRKVVIIDCNMTTPHLGLYVGLHESPITFNHVINKKAHIEDALYHHNSGFGIIPASLKLNDIGGVDLSRIREVIKEEYKDFFSKYDYVFLDCAPGLGREAIAGMRTSDECILVATPHIPSVMDVIKCKEMLHEFGVKPSGVVMNMIRGLKTELSNEYVENLTKMRIISSIPVDKEVLHSLAHRIPVSLYKPRSKATKNMYNIVLHILEGDR